MAQIKWQLILLAYIFYKQYGNVESTLQRIVNGFHATPKQFPYQVLIQHLEETSWKPWCGGVIISNRLIVTAAHCLDLELDSIQIFFGAVDRENAREPGQQRLMVKTKNFFVHPEWESEQTINDIALIRLPADLQFDDYIQPAKLPDPSQLYNDEVGVVSGWGKIFGLAKEIPRQLMYYNVSVLSNEECKPIFRKYEPKAFFLSSQICLKPSESSACRGDSGGPLVIKNGDGSATLLGVASFVMDTNCSVYQPIVYTRVSSFLEWIKTHE